MKVEKLLDRRILTCIMQQATCKKHPATCNTHLEIETSNITK
jgi:hypothetical protein